MSLIDRKSLSFFCKETRISIIPTRKADANIFLIALKQDYIDAQYVKLPYTPLGFREETQNYAGLFCVVLSGLF